MWVGLASAHDLAARQGMPAQRFIDSENRQVLGAPKGSAVLWKCKMWVSTVSKTGVEAVGLQFSGGSNSRSGGSSKASASQTNRWVSPDSRCKAMID